MALLGSLDPPTSAFMITSRFADPAGGPACDAVEHQWRELREISWYLGLAVLVAEDQRFFEHRGFDTAAIRRALSNRTAGGRLRGASTISQQVAKNLFLWPGRSFLRKGLEAWWTGWIEHLWPKRRILEVYLNVAQFGPCLFGAEAASRRFFEIDASALGPEQAALLATVLPSPRRLRAGAPGPYAIRRSGEILALMEEHRDRTIGVRLRRLFEATRPSAAGPRSPGSPW